MPKLIQSLISDTRIGQRRAQQSKSQQATHWNFEITENLMFIEILKFRVLKF